MRNASIVAFITGLISASAFGATYVPVQLINPSGSSAGQAIVSTGPSTPPAWGTNGMPVLNTISALQSATSTSLSQSQVDVLNYSAVGDGGGGFFSIGPTATANGCTIFNDASGRSWYRQGAGSVPVNVRWCGAKADGVTLDTAAFVSALSTGKSVFVPIGSYAIADNSLTLSAGQTLAGAGRASYLNGSYAGGTLITCTTRSTHPCISVAAGANWATLRDFTLSGSGTLGAIASGNTGVAFLGDCNYCKVDGVELYNHYTGLNLGGSTFGWVQNLLTQNNTGPGVLMQNTTSTPLQWQFTNVLSQFNGAQGLIFQSQTATGATQMTLGALTNVATFANSGVGLAVVGTSGVPIYDIRVTNSFFGQDGNSELYFQPYGGNITVTGTQIELAGTGPTGPNNSTPASNVGYGVQVLNGTSYAFTGNWINGNAQGGFANTGLSVNVTGNVITNNGANGTAGTAIGITNNSGGALDMNGNTIQNTGGGTVQKYAVSNAGTINVSIGNNMKPNATGTFNGTAATVGGATLNNQ